MVIRSRVGNVWKNGCGICALFPDVNTIKIYVAYVYISNAKLSLKKKRYLVFWKFIVSHASQLSRVSGLPFL